MALLIDSALTPTRGGADPLAGELGPAVLAMSEPFRRLVSTDFGYAETGDTVLRDRFAACVERRLHDPELGIDEIARKLGCSRRRLYSAFERAQTSPGQQLRDQRLARAHAALTRDGAHSVAEVAFACGFRSAPHFTRAFKARYGCPPAALRALRSATRD